MTEMDNRLFQASEDSSTAHSKPVSQNEALRYAFLLSEPAPECFGACSGFRVVCGLIPSSSSWHGEPLAMPTPSSGRVQSTGSRA